MKIALKRQGAPRKILVLRLGALGDIIFLLPAVTLLHASWPEAEIHWLVKRSYAALIEAHPAITRCWSFEGGLGGILRAARALRREGFDLVLDYHSNLRSGIISALSGGTDRVSFAAPFNKEWNALFNHHQVAPASLDTHKVDRNLTLTRSLPGISSDGLIKPALPRFAEAERSIETLLAGRPRPVLIIHAGVSPKGEIKRWFEDRYAAVARAAAQRTGATIVLIWGSAREQELVQGIAELADIDALVPQHRLSFPELLSLIQRADLYLGVDSGPLHLANIAGLPVLAIYGPKSLAVYRPYFEGARVLSRNEAVGCPPCNATHCHNPDGRVCLEALSADEVTAALLSMITGNNEVMMDT